MDGYSIHPTTGHLSHFGTYPTGPSPEEILSHPNGLFAYTVNNNNQGASLSQYSINASTGELNHLGPLSVCTFPRNGLFIQGGAFAYLVSDNGTFAYAVDPVTGLWTATGRVLILRTTASGPILKASTFTPSGMTPWRPIPPPLALRP